MLNILMFGAPGSGKGTQSEFIKTHYNLQHISTGELLRNEIRRGSAVGKRVEDLIAKGHLVSDEIIIEILDAHLDEIKAREGIIFDGFPRTLPQAIALEEMLGKRQEEITILIELSVEEEELVRRIVERGKVSGRSDDNEEAVRERLKVYHDQTEPVLDYFKERGKYLSVDGSGSISEITERVIRGIDALKK